VIQKAAAIYVDQEERLDYLLTCLISEYPEEMRFPQVTGYAQKRALLRKLVNIRPPRPASECFMEIQDAFLREEVLKKGIVRLSDIPACPSDERISLWLGDITRLEVDAIVNAANSKLLGCFVPGHSCIDNAIHTFAGVQLRNVCHELMKEQGHDEATGTAKISPAYNLPSRCVLHTVGPIVQGSITKKHRDELASCYRSCFTLAAEQGLESIAFCCISTGEFRFPNQAAAKIAVRTVRELLTNDAEIKRVIFNVFTDDDCQVYSGLLE
jgi:O-acetyl-ADP-ribose deacetylase (regulator of RNase III)